MVKSLRYASLCVDIFIFIFKITVKMLPKLLQDGFTSYQSVFFFFFDIAIVDRNARAFSRSRATPALVLYTIKAF